MPSLNSVKFRKFSPVAHGPLDGFDYRSLRPFKTYKRLQLEILIKKWLALDPPRLELATLAYEELKERGKERRALGLFDELGFPPIPWLSEARKISSAEFSPSTYKRGRACVYAILRWGYSEKNSWYGLYIGQTSKSVECRYKQHREGNKSGRGLEKYGIELSYSLFKWINPIRAAQRYEIETQLHKIIKDIGVKVSGDVQPQSQSNTH